MQNPDKPNPESASLLSETTTKTIAVTGLTNREFLEQYARAGRVGLTGGVTLVDRAITRAEKRMDPDGTRSLWSHAFLFQGTRIDGHHWVIESDIQIHRKNIQLGAQENRMAKFYDDDFYTTMAVLDFGLPEAMVSTLLIEAMELVATRNKYSVRELIGTLLVLRDPNLRAKENKMARDGAMYCSAFVRHLFHRAGIDLVPGVHGKHTTPEDISRTPVPHVKYVLQRDVPLRGLAGLKGKVKTRIDTIKGRARDGGKTLGR